MTDTLLLIGRVLLAAVFYRQSLNYPTPAVVSDIAHVAEWIIVISLVLGIGTRYGALFALVFVVIVFGTHASCSCIGHVAQPLKFILLNKDLAIAGGLLVLFVTGGGRFSVDEQLRHYAATPARP
jgi:putative oxidoreductase